MRVKARQPDRHHLVSRRRFFLRWVVSLGLCFSQSASCRTQSFFSFSTMCQPIRRAQLAWKAVRHRGARHWMHA
eukprot:scaffold2376_cov115-Isochrysis_galbana.AAC.9